MKLPLVAPVAFDADCGAGCDNGNCMEFLRAWTLFELQKCVYQLLAVVKDRPQFHPASISDPNDVPQRNGLACQLTGDGLAEEAVAMKNAYFTHVARVEANRHVFTYVGCQGKRQVAQTLKVNAVAPHLTRTNFLHQQKIQLLKGFRHTR